MNIIRIPRVDDASHPLILFSLLRNNKKKKKILSWAVCIARSATRALFIYVLFYDVYFFFFFVFSFVSVVCVARVSYSVIIMYMYTSHARVLLCR